jgi:Tol biopolymer transport system component
MKYFLLFLALLFIILSSCKKNDDPAPAAATFKALYRSSVNGASTNYELYTKEGDKAPVKITDNSTLSCYQPRISPDKQKILFFRNPAVGSTALLNTTDAELWVMNADGSGATKIVSKNANGWNAMSSANWSPDGSKIVVAARNAAGDTRWHVFTINANGSSPVQITTRAAFYQGPVFSPDGSKIACTSVPSATFNTDSTEIYVMNANGANETRITFNTVQDAQPAWTPNGATIVFSTAIAANRYGIRETRPDGTSQRTLFSDVYNNYAPRLNPAGDYVFFIRQASGVSIYPHVACVQINGTGLVDVTSGNSAYDDDVDMIN